MYLYFIFCGHDGKLYLRDNVIQLVNHDVNKKVGQN